MIFIEKGQEPLSVRQATKRGMSYVASELAQAGARKGDEELLRVIPQADLPERLATIVTNLGFDSYADYAADWEAQNVINGENNLFNYALAAYRAATARLAQYRLADGRAEIVQDGEVTQTAIDPLPAQIEQPVYDPDTGEETGTEMIDNPAIVADDAERAAAQAVIDATPADVLAFE